MWISQKLPYKQENREKMISSPIMMKHINRKEQENDN